MQWKKCTKCGKNRPLSEFSFKNKAKGWRASECKQCHKVYDARYYRDNTKPYRHRNRLYRERNKEWRASYLAGKRCIDCGEDNSLVLEFDHVGEKSGNLSDMIRKGWSVKRLEAEAAKCEIRCANCHRIKTRAA